MLKDVGDNVRKVKFVAHTHERRSLRPDPSRQPIANSVRRELFRATYDGRRVSDTDTYEHVSMHGIDAESRHVHADA
jgi:hypothetical protein